MKPGDEGYIDPVRGEHESEAEFEARRKPPLIGIGRDRQAPSANLYEGGSGRVHDDPQPHSEHRRRMPMERQSLTHKVTIGGQEGYFTAGMYEDGTLGELFVSGFGKEGSTQVGWINSWAIAVSHALQYGSSLRSLARKYHLMRFEPNGKTDNPEIPECFSVPDYIFRWLVLRFGDDTLKEEILG